MQDHLSSRLTEKIEILTLIQDDDAGNIAWAPARKRWAAVELDTRRNIFTVVGVGTRGATVTIRPDPRLTLHQAIRWRGEFLHLTDIVFSPERDCPGDQSRHLRTGDTDGQAAGQKRPG